MTHCTWGRWNTRGLLTLGLAAILCGNTALASPHDIFGFGPRSMAMGGLGASFTDDFGSVHANPAGLSRATERQFALGFLGAGYALTMAQGDGPDRPFPVDRARATTIGLTLPLPFGGVLRDRIALGVGFYTPTDIVVRGRVLAPETPQFLVIADRTQSVAIQLGIGFNLGGGFRVGAGFSALAAIVGNVLVATDATGRAGSRVDNQLVASYAPTVGVSWERGPFRAGIVYRGEIIGRLSVVIRTMNIGIDLPPLNIAGIAQYDPHQIASEVGFAHQGWTAAVGATVKLWQLFPGPTERTTPMSTIPPAPNFSPTVVLRAGVERRWDWSSNRSFVAVRGGYFYEPTPAPLATGRANYLDNDRHVLTAGVAVGGRILGTHVGLDVFGQAHILAPRTNIKAPVGMMDVTMDNPGLPSLRTGGVMYMLGFSASVSF